MTRPNYGRHSTLFAAGLLATVVASGVTGHVLAEQAVSHAHACRPTQASTGTASYVTGAVSNSSSSSRLILSCPLTSPESGFGGDPGIFADVYDGASNADVRIRSCWTLRSSVGAGCSYSDYSYGTGTHNLETGLDTWPGSDAAYSVEVNLPKLSGWTSQVMAFGYMHENDVVYDSDLGELFYGMDYLSGQVSSHSSQINTLNDNVVDLDNRVSNLEMPF